jgi:hypothetical protein
VRAGVEQIVDRLRDSGSLPWLRVIDAAGLDAPVEPEAAPEQVVAPYRWLLEQIGDGVRLTQAGYLPPALVVSTMTELDWVRAWSPGKREVDTPVLELRESAQRFGLLRKNRGELLVTKLGRRLMDDPSELWWHLASVLPAGRSEPQRQAGILFMLTVAAGRPEDNELLADGMSILGWSVDGIQSVDPISAFRAARDTWWLFHWLRLAPEPTRWDAPKPAPTEQGRTFARAALLGREQPALVAAPAPQAKAEQAVQVLVQLRDIEPAIWRRVVVPASLTLRELHAVIQTAMGWEGYHLHMFDVAGTIFGDVEDFDGELGDEDTFTVGQAAATGHAFSYEYDFGDGWTHDVKVEQLMASVGVGTPHLLGGARACPPEDCGGSWGYEHLLEVLADPHHSEHKGLLEWLGDPYDPDAFDLAETNANLELYDRHTRQRRMRTP